MQAWLWTAPNFSRLLYCFWILAPHKGTRSHQDRPDEGLPQIMIQIILIIDPMPSEDAKVFIVIQEMHIRKYQRKTNWFGLYLPHSDSFQLQAMLILHLQYPSWDKLWVWWTIWSRLRVWWSLFYPIYCSKFGRQWFSVIIVLTSNFNHYTPWSRCLPSMTLSTSYARWSRSLWPNCRFHTNSHLYPS